jgi:hypothetical protein
VPNRHVVLAFLEPAERREDEFSSWLDETFVQRALRLAGVESVQRFTARLEFLHFPPPPGREVLLFELDGDTDAGVAALGDLLSPAALPASGKAAALSSIRELRPELRREGLPDDLVAREPRDLLVFYLGPVAGREDEYHDWYDRAHVRDGITLPGFVTGQRFVRDRYFLDLAPAPSDFAVIYEIAGEDIDTAIEAAKASAGQFEHSDAADTATMRAYALESSGPLLRRVGDRRVSDGAAL